DLIYTLLADAEGNLWAGGTDGLYRLNPTRFITYTTEQGLTHNNVMSVCEDGEGSMWIATWGGGVNQFKDGKFSSFGSPHSLSHASALSLLPSKDGSLWVGMDFNGGLNHIKDDHRNLIQNQDGLNGAAIRVIHEDCRGTLWIGTSKGVLIRKGNELKAYGPAE